MFTYRITDDLVEHIMFMEELMGDEESTRVDVDHRE